MVGGTKMSQNDTLTHWCVDVNNNYYLVLWFGLRECFVFQFKLLADVVWNWNCFAGF
jgi:hypothetical protein